MNDAGVDPALPDNDCRAQKHAQRVPEKKVEDPSAKLPVCDDMNDAAVPYPQPNANCRRDDSLTQKSAKAIQTGDDELPLCIDMADPIERVNCRKEANLAQAAPEKKVEDPSAHLPLCPDQEEDE